MIQTRITDRLQWAPGLVTLKLEGSLEPFEAGQWTNLARSFVGNEIAAVSVLSLIHI